MRTSLKLLPLLIVAALATPLTGCAVSITDGEGPDAAPSARQSAPSEATEKEDVPGESEPDESEQADDDITREQLVAAATRTMRCDGELTILDDAVAVRVDGDCDHLILNSTGSQVVTGDVALLEVIGDGNLVLTGAVDELLVNGTGNMVHWTGTTPTVSDIGEANLLKAG